MSQNEHYPRFPRSRPMRYGIENSKFLLFFFGAALGAVVGVALDLRGYWPVLPAILGAAVGLVAAHDDRPQRPSWANMSGMRRRSPRHFGDPPP